MNFGYYDNDNREYVITRPDTPTPWLNYLGNGGFSGIISNTAGGLVFDRDPGNFRISYGGIPVKPPFIHNFVAFYFLLIHIPFKFGR